MHFALSSWQKIAWIKYEIDIRPGKWHTFNNIRRKGGLIMSLSTIIFFVGLLGAICGAKSPYLYENHYDHN
jgi:hypothetical protein